MTPYNPWDRAPRVRLSDKVPCADCRAPWGIILPDGTPLCGPCLRARKAKEGGVRSLSERDEME